MSIATELSRIQADRDTIRSKLVEMGLATNTDKLDALATAISGIVNKGAVQVEIVEGQSYTIPAGYHNGSGTVVALTDESGEAEKYKLQQKTVTPTKSQQSVTKDEGFYGLSSVTVNPIPDAYQNVSSVTATAGNVLTGKIFVTADGTVTTGTMKNNGAVSKTLDVTTISYTIPTGYHSGSGKVTIVLEEKSATPTKSTQTISPTSGKVLSKVTVNPIPDNFIDTTDADAVAADILDGKFAYVDGVKVEGTMPNNGAVTQTLTTSTTSYTVPAGYHNGSGKVSITTENKSATPTESSQTITPSTGKVLKQVTVNAIPKTYANTTGATATAGNLLTGTTAYGSGKDSSGNTVAALIEGSMPNNGAQNITAKPSSTATDLTIKAGYHSGSGKVSVSAKALEIAPTKQSQSFSSGDDYYHSVSVSAIPAEYQVVTNVTATAADVLDGKVIVDATGAEIEGTMPNNGAISKTLTTGTTSYTVPAGYTSGGKVSITTETKTATPTKSTQNITPSSGKVLSKVTVNSIPAAYQDVTNVTATAADVLTGTKIVDATGIVVDGAMPNNGAITGEIDGLTNRVFEIAPGYTSGGTVFLTNDIEDALAAI